MMTHQHKLAAAGLAALVFAADGMAAAQTAYPPAPQQVMISPAQGQTADQQSRDTYDCETGASSRSGWHPSQGTATPPPTKPQAGGRVAGAARGAARGAIREQTSDKSDRELENPSEAGARAGAAAGATQQRQARREYRKTTQQEQAAMQQKQQNYYQQFRSCLQSRGYTVQ